MSTYIGYAKLRPGRIHLFCPKCKRKLSNIPRNEGGHYPDDPAGAVLAHVWCERCSHGCKESEQIFFDARGRELCGFCGGRCARAGGRGRCTERLVNESVARSLAKLNLPAPEDEKPKGGE